MVENVGQKIKKRFEKILTADSMVKIISKIGQKIRLVVLVQIGQYKKYLNLFSTC